MATTKSVVLVARVTPEMKELADKIAKIENRNISNLMETLLIEKAKRLHLINNDIGERS